MKHCHKHFCLVAWGLSLAGLLAVQPAAAVVLSFTGTVTDVGSVNVSPPEGVGIGAAVSGTVTYDPAEASMIEVGPSERAYVFLPGTGNEITVEIGTHVWKTDLQTVGVCDEVCDGDYLDHNGLSSTTVSFPDNLGTGFLLIEFADFEATYDLLDGTDLPNATEDINFAAAIVKMGSVYSNGPSGFWNILFEVDSPSVPATTSTWSEVKALYARP